MNCYVFFVKHAVIAPIFCPCRKNEQEIIKKIKDWLLRCDEQNNGYWTSMLWTLVNLNVKSAKLLQRNISKSFQLS